MAKVVKKGRYLYRAYRRLRWGRLGLLLVALAIAASGLYWPVMLLFFPIPLVFYKRLEKKKRILKTGLEGERITARRLKELPKHFAIYSDLYFNGSQIDHLVLGKSGLYVVETKHLRGLLTGHGREEQWLLKKREGHRRKVYNPMRQVSTHAKQVRLGLSVKGVPIVPLVHLTHPEGRLVVTDPTTLFVEERTDTRALGQWIERLDREREPLPGRTVERIKEQLGGR